MERIETDPKFSPTLWGGNKSKIEIAETIEALGIKPGRHLMKTSRGQYVDFVIIIVTKEKNSLFHSQCGSQSTRGDSQSSYVRFKSLGEKSNRTIPTRPRFESPILENCCSSNRNQQRATSLKWKNKKIVRRCKGSTTRTENAQRDQSSARATKGATRKRRTSEARHEKNKIRLNERRETKQEKRRIKIERKNKILKENRKKMIWEFLLQWKKNYLFSYIKYLLVHFLYPVSSVIFCLLNPVVKCPRIFWVIFFLMMPSALSSSPKSSRTWNFVNFLNEEEKQTQLVTIHHQPQDKRSRTLDLLPEPKKRKYHHL